MSEVLLTLSCGVHDAEAIATTLRDSMALPVRERREMVHGRDFDDAGTVERVAGTLARMAIEVELPPGRVAEALALAMAVRRRLPFRWRTTAILDGGRIA